MGDSLTSVSWIKWEKMRHSASWDGHVVWSSWYQKRKKNFVERGVQRTQQTCLLIGYEGLECQADMGVDNSAEMEGKPHTQGLM